MLPISSHVKFVMHMCGKDTLDQKIARQRQLFDDFLVAGIYFQRLTTRLIIYGTCYNPNPIFDFFPPSSSSATLPPPRTHTKTGPPSVLASLDSSRARRPRLPWPRRFILISRSGRTEGQTRSSAGARRRRSSGHPPPPTFFFNFFFGPSFPGLSSIITSRNNVTNPSYPNPSYPFLSHIFASQRCVVRCMGK